MDVYFPPGLNIPFGRLRNNGQLSSLVLRNRIYIPNVPRYQFMDVLHDRLRGVAWKHGIDIPEALIPLLFTDVFVRLPNGQERFVRNPYNFSQYVLSVRTMWHSSGS
jgi:hypothetical protein